MLQFWKRHLFGTSFSTRFLGAVLLLVIIEGVGLYTFGEYVTKARVDPNLLNEVSRMRLLLMQTDALAHHFRYASADSVRYGVQNELRAAAIEMESITARLLDEVYSKNARRYLEAPPSRLALRLQAYSSAALALASDPEPSSGALADVGSRTGPLGNDIDTLTHLLETDYRKALRRGQMVYLAGGGLTFLTLLLLGLFVFRPMETKLREEYRQSKDRERARDLEAANNELKEEIMRRWEAEATLIDRERHFRKVIMGASDPIFIQELGEKGIFTNFSEVNESAVRHLGYTREELVNLSPAELVEGFDELGPENFGWMAGDRTLVMEMNLIAKDGRRLPFECRMDVHEIGDRRIMMCLARDISRRIAVEQAMREENEELEMRVAERTAQLERQTAELEAANEELEAFAYSVSHDLRAPIRSLVGFSRLMLERMNGSGDETIHHYVTRIQANAAKMGSLVDDLLAYSRIGRTTARRSKTDPRPLIDEILRDAVAVERRATAVRVDDLPHVEADSTLLRQVYLNLISNALKFTRNEPRPTIAIGARELNGETVYYVQDNGVGFDMKYADKLFGVFQRLHSSSTYEGTGAGLAIVERIVRKHGGRIWAESEPNAGATFYFTLKDRAA